MATTRTYIESFSDHVDETVTVKGWVQTRRSKGKIHFIVLRDGTGVVQVVVGINDVDEETFALCNTLTLESSVHVTGIVRKDDRAPGGFEMHVSGVKLVQRAKEYPIQKKEHDVSFLMPRRHLWLRSTKQHATLRIRDEVVRSIRDFFAERKFLCVDAPIFTPAACEGTSTLFEVNYFDEKAYLTQSGQLYMEAAAMAHGNVYCFGPTFRAEKSKTRRHLTEFWMVEPEMTYADLDDVMDLAEDFVRYIVGRCLEHCAEHLKVLERDTAPLEKMTKPFARLAYDDAVTLLKEKGHDFEWGGDFGAPDETALGEAYDTPMFVHRYPAEIKAFYMKRDPQDDRLALCVDLIAPEGYGEIIGGGQRADSLEYLEEQIEKHQLPKESFEWYLDLRRYGSVPHGGFGLGVERTVAWICGTKHVRETIPFPRMLDKIYP